MRPDSLATHALVVFLASVTFFAACNSGADAPASGTETGTGGGDSASCTADLSSIQQNVFTRSCTQAGCHNATDKAAAMDLTAPDLASQLVNQSSNCADWVVVAPGSPEKSSLFGKIDGTPPCGSHMPLGGAELSPAEKECIRGWIAGLTAGASDAGSDASNCGDTDTSVANCGSCGHACPTGASCVSGKCACPSGASTLCGTSCVNAETDLDNCGSCGNACPPASDKTKKYCVSGVCSATCSQYVCPTDGACVDNQTDVTHCGTACVRCASGQACNAGKCECPAGTILCDGVCVSNSTTSNCGTCGTVCAPGTTCNAGTCECGASVSFSGAVQPIFTQYCATSGCHVKGAGTNVQNLDLSLGGAYANLNPDVKLASECSDGRYLVHKSAPSTSYLVQKLLGVNMCGPGTQMPKKGMSLSSAQIGAISNWICEGAPNN